MRRALIALAALLALASAGAGGVRAGDDEELGLVLQSRVYIDQGGGLLLESRSTVPVVVTFEPSGGWAVEPASLVLGPGEGAAAEVLGEGEDGAGIGVRVAAVEPPTGGAQASELLLTSRVFHATPFDLGPLAWWALFGLVASATAAWTVRRLRPWEWRVTRAA